MKAFTLTIVLCLSSAARLPAQTLTVVHDFTGGPDGAGPLGGLILSGNTLYGTTSAGGGAGNGTVFAVNTDGVGFTNLHSFTADSGSPATIRDGASRTGGLFLSGDKLAGPQAGLVLSANTLYGTTHRGGSSGSGTVFALNLDGTGFTNLHSFVGSDGAVPQAALIVSGNTLFGTTTKGGLSGFGTVFVINTDGTGFNNLHSFTGAMDGAFPQADLIVSGYRLYGTASFGGGGLGAGTVFTLNTAGTDFTNLHTFTGFDGAWPEAGLILSGDTLCGTTFYGGVANGDSNDGMVFKLDLNGTPKRHQEWNPVIYGHTLHVATLDSVITHLHDFTNFHPVSPYANLDGARPRAGLILSGNLLYGTTSQGGSSGRWHGLCRQHQWLGFYQPVQFHRGKRRRLSGWPAGFIGSHSLWDDD